MIRAYKYRLYPTDGQAELLDKHIDACRFIYNLALETKIYAYRAHKINIGKNALIKQLPELKSICQWLNILDSQALQQTIIDLDQAFTSFFKGRSKFPSYKKKTNKSTFRNPHGSAVKISGNRVCFPRFREGIRFAYSIPIAGVIKNSTISKTPTGKYYISIAVDNGKSAPEKIMVTQAIGIDLGLTHFAITSDGIKIDNPKYLKGAVSHLRYLQRQSAKKQRGSNREKANHKIAIQHEKVSNKRMDFLHKLSSKLISDNQAICFEDLNIKGMVKNHKLSQSISDVGWGEFVSQCKYKALWSGKHVLQIPRFEPSSKKCHVCGWNNNKLALSDRSWVCNCGTTHDRDINAAINIRDYCLKKISGEAHRIKPVELPVIAGAKKQEV